jgi:hypothetical protein
MAGHVFHPGHDEWHGQTVVVSTQSARTVVGRWDAIVGGQVQMRDVAVHEEGPEVEPAAAWIERLKTYGIPVQYATYALSEEDVTGVVRLRDA